MSSESTSNPSKNIASDQKKNQKPSSFRFNVNAEPFDPSKRGSSSNPATYDGNHGEHQIQESTNFIAPPAISTSTGMQAQHRYTHNQPTPQNTSFGYAPTAYLMPQYQLRPCSGFQPGGPMVYLPPPQPAMYVQPSGSVYQQPMMNQLYSGPNPSMNMSLPLQRPISGPPPGSAPYNGYGTHQQPMMNQSYSGPNPSMNMSLPPQCPQGQARPEARNRTVGRSSQNKKLQGRQPSKKQAGPGSSDRSRSNPQTNGAPSTQAVTEEVSNITKEQEFEAMRVELEQLRTHHSAVKSWAKSVNINLDSVLVDHKPAASSSNVSAINIGHGDTLIDDIVVKPDAISEKKTSEPPETSKTVPISIPKLDSTEKAEKAVESVEKTAEAKHPANQVLDEIFTTDTQNVRVELERPIGLEETSGAKTLLSTSNVHSPTVEPISYSNVVRTGLQEISSVQQSSKKAMITPTKTPETIVVKDKENVQPLEKKVPDYSNWVNRDKVHKKWAAENSPAVEVADDVKVNTSPTETPILQQKPTKGKGVSKLQKSTSQLTANLTTDVHIGKQSRVEPVEKSPKGVKNTPECGTSGISEKEGSKPEEKSNQKSDETFTTDVHKKSQSSVKPVKKNTKGMKKTPGRGTSSGNSSMSGPSENTGIVYESEEVKQEEEFKAQLCTQTFADQCENIKKYLFAKGKKELIEKERGASIDSDLHDESSLRDTVEDYVDVICLYSEKVYPLRASDLAFERKRAALDPLQELIIAHLRQNPLYGHRAKRIAAKIDTIVRGRLEHYKNLDTLEGQQVYCFLAAVMMLDRECLTEDLLFLYGSRKSESRLSEQEIQYFDMVLLHVGWIPSKSRPKPAVKEDLKGLPVELDAGDVNNFLALLNNQSYLRIQQAEKAKEMDTVQSLVYDAYMDSREKDIDCSPKHTTDFLRSRAKKLNKIKNPSEQIIKYKAYYEFLTYVSSNILDFDVYWFKQCLDPQNTEAWHCFKSDADFFKYLFSTSR